MDAAVRDAVGVAGVLVVAGSSSTAPDPSNISNTLDTTMATAAATTAISAVLACLLRYHGAGAGSKRQVSGSNASNDPAASGSAIHRC